jgi:hypothetical protein
MELLPEDGEPEDSELEEEMAEPDLTMMDAEET